MTRRLSMDEAVEALAIGLVIAIPTDTVYGLAADWRQPAAVAQIFALKQRPSDVALPLLVAAQSQIDALGVTWDSRAAALAREWWPGALTIAVPAPDHVAQALGAQGSVGLRQPANPVTQELLARTGPLAVTSANRHGEAPASHPLDVDLVWPHDEVAGVLDGGVCEQSPSTVVELLRHSWRLRRAGAVSASDLTRILGPAVEWDEGAKR